MIFWLIISFVCVIIGTIGIIIFKKNSNNSQNNMEAIGSLIFIFGLGIGIALLLACAATAIEYNEFLFRYNEIEAFPEPGRVMIENINNQLMQYQAKKKMYGVFSLYPNSVLNLEYFKVP